MPDRDAENVLDELLALPPQEFTTARNAAAKQLLSDGQREAAAEIRKLARPPVSVWVLNQLAHHEPALVETFLAAADRLREAYRSGGDIRAATSPEREAEARVAAAALALARARGASVTETVSRGLRQTLSAAAADAGVAAELQAGRLLREPDAPSIDQVLESLPQRTAAKAPPARRATKERRDGKAERRAREEDVASAKAAASQARREARAAADAEAAAQRESERAQRAAEKAQRTSDAAEKRLEELQQRLSEN